MHVLYYEIYETSTFAIKSIIEKSFGRFPKLIDKIDELMNTFIETVKIIFFIIEFYKCKVHL